jgi:hypothetical protein
MIELVAGQYRDEDGDCANDATCERDPCRAHRTVALEKGMIRQPGSG